MEINWYELIEHIMFLAVTIVIPFVVKYIKSKNQTENMDKVLEYAEIAVRYAEQFYKDQGGEVKYQEASKWLSNQALKVGIKLSDDEVRGIIEGVLKKIAWEFEVQMKK